MELIMECGSGMVIKIKKIAGYYDIRSYDRTREGGLESLGNYQMTKKELIKRFLISRFNTLITFDDFSISLSESFNHPPLFWYNYECDNSRDANQLEIERQKGLEDIDLLVDMLEDINITDEILEN